MPVPYFTPVHKAKRTVNQGVSSRTQRNGIDEIFTGITNSQESENEDENEDDDEVIPDEPLGSNISGSYGSRRLSSRPLSRVYGDSETQNAKSKRSNSKKSFDTPLNSLGPPLLAPQLHAQSGTHVIQNSTSTSVRQRHLTVLTSILHRSLLQYDYFRAARAWSMILRSELDGHSVDLRNGCRWGLGAEILLQHQGWLSRSNEWPNAVVESDSNALQSSEKHLVVAKFDKLRQYYDRLSLQYPYHKSFPDAVGPLDFRAAMFGLWIYTCTDQKSLGADTDAPVSEQGPQRKGMVTQNALREALDISEELSELTSSPPYSDSKTLKKLLTMVDRWIADLEPSDDG